MSHSATDPSLAGVEDTKSDSSGSCKLLCPAGETHCSSLRVTIGLISSFPGSETLSYYLKSISNLEYRAETKTKLLTRIMLPFRYINAATCVY